MQEHVGVGLLEVGEEGLHGHVLVEDCPVAVTNNQRKKVWTQIIIICIVFVLVNVNLRDKEGKDISTFRGKENNTSRR